MGWGFIYLVASGDHVRGAEVGGLVCNAVALDLILKWVEDSRWNSKGCVDEEEEGVLDRFGEPRGGPRPGQVPERSGARLGLAILLSEKRD